MTSASTLLVPSFLRKKAVKSNYNPNSYRVIYGDAEFCAPRQGLPLVEHLDHLSTQYELPETNFAIRPRRDLRHHNPQPWHCTYLRENARTLNDPICHMTTWQDRENQPRWWENSASTNKEKQDPSYSYDSTMRQDFRGWKSAEPERITRHSSNMNNRAANGIIPVNRMWEKDGKVTTWKEKISYEQQYDCRQPNNYPIRTKRHGAFVWNQINDPQREQLLEFNHLPKTHDEAKARDLETDAAAKTAALEMELSEHRPPPFIMPHRIPYHRAFQKRQRFSEDESVATLMHPEYRFPWKKPSTSPLFTD